MDYTENIWGEEEKIRAILGESNLLDALEKAMGTDELGDLLAFIARNHDIETTLKEKE